MRPFLRLITLLAFVPALVQIARPQTLNPNDARDSVVRIFSIATDGASTGTGFVLSDRVVATNYHVIDGANQIIVAFATATGVETTPATIRFSSSQKDLAILETNDDLLGVPLTLATRDPELTADVTAIGFPGAADIVAGDGLDPNMLIASVTKGGVSRIIPQVAKQGGARVIQHTAPINPGNSGGPLLDACGRVVGINTFKPGEAFDSQGIFFSVSAFDLANLLTDRLIDHTESDKACVPGMHESAETTSQPSEAESADDVERFARFVSCTKRYPCDAELCGTKYRQATHQALFEKRLTDVSSITARSGNICQERFEEKAFVSLEVCARDTPCQYSAVCEPAYVGSANSEARARRQPALKKMSENAQQSCVALHPTAPQPTAPTPGPAAAIQPNTPTNPAPSGPSSSHKIAPRTYWATLSYSQPPDAEFLKGNCIRTDGVKIVVAPDFTVTWTLRESTRASKWRGSVDPATGGISVVSSGVTLLTRANEPTGIAVEASVSGAFHASRLEFAPCGTGILRVRS
ncbi:MAG: serine protease [Mesorhizobium sp.]|nr:serine protease [Mesorhizobium sp.]